MTTEPVTDLPDAEYFALPHLSHSDTKLLHRSPAIYRWAKDHPEEQTHSDAFDFGKAVHRLALGVGPEIVTIDADNWRTNGTTPEHEATYHC